MNPSIGRIVHWESPIHGPQAAIITAVHDETVSLTVLGANYPACFESAAPYAEEPKPYHWSWPPRVGA